MGNISDDVTDVLENVYIMIIPIVAQQVIVCRNYFDVMKHATDINFEQVSAPACSFL